MEYIQTDEQVADIFTKALCRQSFVKFRDKLGLLPNPFIVERVLKSMLKKSASAKSRQESRIQHP